MDFYDEEIIDGKHFQTYKNHNDEIVRLDDIVRNLQSKGVAVSNIEVEEACELEMKSFGEKNLSPDDFGELRRYNTGFDYRYTIKAEYRDEPIVVYVYRSIFCLESENQELKFSDIF